VEYRIVFKYDNDTALNTNNTICSVTDHTGKDEFFDIIEEKSSLSEQENEMLIKHFENRRNQIGGAIRIEQMMKLIEYLEDRE
jgi:hypothetical protein